MPRRSLLRFLLGGFVFLLIAAIAAYGGVTWYMVDQAITAKRNPIEATPASVGLAFEEVSFPARAAALTLRGWYIPAPEGAKGTLLLVHGLDSNREGKGARGLDIARDFHRAGFHLLLFDLRAHGESESAVLSAGYFETQDVLGALDYVTEERGARWDRVGVLGFSLGGAITLLAAEQEPRLRAVVVDSPFADLSDLIVAEAAKRINLSPTMARALVPGMVLLARLRYGIPLDQVRPLRSVGELDYPLLLIHGEADTRIPPEHSQRLRQAAKHPATDLWLVPGAAHVAIYRSLPKEYVNRVSDYFFARFEGRSSALQDAVGTPRGDDGLVLRKQPLTVDRF